MNSQSIQNLINKASETSSLFDLNTPQICGIYTVESGSSTLLKQHWVTFRNRKQRVVRNVIPHLGIPFDEAIEDQSVPMKSMFQHRMDEQW